MPDALSMWTPCGMLELSSAPSYAETIYTSLVGSLSKAFDMTAGTRMESWAYAYSMQLARAKYSLDRAANQAHPLTAYDLLPILEQAYLVVPVPRASVAERAAVLAAIDALGAGGALPNIASGLRSLLGDDLLAVVPMGQLLAQNSGAPTVYPSSPGTGGGNFVDPRTEGQYLQTIDPVTLGGKSWPVPPTPQS